MPELKYTRAVLKLSGEALAGEGTGIDPEVARRVCGHVMECVKAGAQMGIVVGGGNFWRGRTGGAIDPVRADKVGMLATMMNALALEGVFERLGQPALVQSACAMPQVAGCIDRRQALEAMDAGKVVIFGGGTGNPFFTTDSAAALRAAEIGAEVVLKATNVDGVYDRDPKKHPGAVRYDAVSYDRILAERLNVMDATCAALCRDKGIPMFVFNLGDPGNILRALRGENVGTLCAS